MRTSRRPSAIQPNTSARAVQQLVAGGDVVRQARAGQVQRAALVQALHRDRVGLPAGRAVEHHVAARAQRGERAVERRLADAVVDDRHAAAAGELAGGVGEVVVADDLVGARAPRELGLLLRPRRRDHAPAPQLDELRQQQPDAAGRGVDEHRVVRLHRVGVDHEVVGGHALEDRRGGDLVRDAVGHRHGALLRHQHALGVAAGSRGPRDAVAGLELRDALPDLRHRAGALGARDERRLGRVEADALALVDVAEVDARRVEVDEQLSGARPRIRLVARLEDLGAALLRHDDRAQNRSPPAGLMDGSRGYRAARR